MSTASGVQNNVRGSIVEFMGADGETKLIKEIKGLLSTQRERRRSSRRTRKELGDIRRQLGEKLHALKGVLVRSGRGGGWSKYLRANDIPRASADRLVAAHEALLHPPVKNILSEAIVLPTEAEVRQYARDLLPRVLKVVRTPDSVFQFVDEVTKHLQAAYCGRPNRSVQ